MDQRDVRLEVFKSSGPGGQHKNKRLTAVRAVHVPTGIAAVGQERRSQEANRRLALERLAARLRALSRRPKPRRPVRPSRAVHARRLAWKKKHKQKKQMRRERFDAE
ncbi:MAG: peptide chain release factor family protein [Deltaproteobacteria bacterium]